MKRFRTMTIASAVAAAFAVPVAFAQTTSPSDTRQQSQQPRDRVGAPAGSPTQPGGAMSSPEQERKANAPSVRGAMRGDHAESGWSSSRYDSSTVRDVQQALQAKGYDVGEIDGVMGPRTQQALREFQQQQGLTRSGRIDQQTLSALNVAQASPPSRTNMGDRSAPSTMGDRTTPGAGSTRDRTTGANTPGSGSVTGPTSSSGATSGAAGSGTASGNTTGPSTMGSRSPGSSGTMSDRSSGGTGVGTPPAGTTGSAGAPASPSGGSSAGRSGG